MTLNELIDRLEMFRDVHGGYTEVRVLDDDTGATGDPSLTMAGSFRTGFYVEISMT